MVGPKYERRDLVLALMEKRKAIDQKIIENGNILFANSINMREPLVDQDGYPRTDIDVAAVRTARHQIICLQNDLQALEDEIRDRIHEFHAEERGLRNTNGTTKMLHMNTNGESSTSSDTSQPTPIVKVNFVSGGSPADAAVSFFFYFIDKIIFIIFY